jgi:uncharacterized membrane protein
VHFGVPFDVAFSVDGTTRLAWLVALGEMQSGTHAWDWTDMRWRETRR